MSVKILDVEDDDIERQIHSVETLRYEDSEDEDGAFLTPTGSVLDAAVGEGEPSASSILFCSALSQADLERDRCREERSVTACSSNKARRDDGLILEGDTASNAENNLQPSLFETSRTESAGTTPDFMSCDAGLVEVVKIAKDGDCLFRASLHQLSLSQARAQMPSDADVMRLRRRVAEYMARNSAMFHSFLDTSRETLEDSIRKITRRGEWAGDEAISAIASIFKRRVVVYLEFGPCIPVEYAEPEPAEMSEPASMSRGIEADIRLAYRCATDDDTLTHFHYDSVVGVKGGEGLGQGERLEPRDRAPSQQRAERGLTPARLLQSPARSGCALAQSLKSAANPAPVQALRDAAQRQQESSASTATDSVERRVRALFSQTNSTAGGEVGSGAGDATEDDEDLEALLAGSEAPKITSTPKEPRATSSSGRSLRLQELPQTLARSRVEEWVEGQEFTSSAETAEPQQKLRLKRKSLPPVLTQAEEAEVTPPAKKCQTEASTSTSPLCPDKRHVSTNVNCRFDVLFGETECFPEHFPVSSSQRKLSKSRTIATNVVYTAGKLVGTFQVL